MAVVLTLDRLNAASRDEFTALLDGTYEHSPWIAAQAADARPFKSLAALKRALVEVVRGSPRDTQIALVRAHPELAGKAMVTQRLTADYNTKFGWPFVLAVRGPRGAGLNRQQIIATFERRLAGHPDFELAECLRNIHRIAELRLDDKFGVTPELGNLVWDWAESLSVHTDPGYAELGQLTVTYLTDAHRACAAQISADMRDCGFDEVGIDAVGNVVGRYFGATAEAKFLI